MPNRRMVNAKQNGRPRRPCGIIQVTALWVLCRYRHKSHWSGAEHRLARDLAGAFGSKSYAREELTAEIASAFICAALGIVPTVRHADYLAAWLALLREDNRAIFRAASQASKAADFILGFQSDAATPAESEQAGAGIEFAGLGAGASA